MWIVRINYLEETRYFANRGKGAHYPLTIDKAEIFTDLKKAEKCASGTHYRQDATNEVIDIRDTDVLDELINL